MKSRRKIKNGGFTLLEMICVISIIVILSSFAIPQFQKYLDEANKAKILSAVSELNNTSILMEVNKSSELKVEEIIKELGRENLGVKLIDGSNQFSVGRYTGTFDIENYKVVANISKPESMKLSLNGKSSYMLLFNTTDYFYI